MKSKGGPVTVHRFIQLFHWMMRSPAFRALSPNAVRVLLDIWLRHNGANNGQIVYSAREAGDILPASKSTGARVLNELVALGFLRITRDSVFRLKSAEAREYALTSEPVDGRAATKDFMHWRPTVTPAKNSTKKQNTVSPMGPNGLTHDTVNRVIPKTPRKNNKSSWGAGGGQTGTGGDPQKTTKNPSKTAKNQAPTVSPMIPSEGVNGLTHEPLLVFHARVGGRPRHVLFVQCRRRARLSRARGKK